MERLTKFPDGSLEPSAPDIVQTDFICDSTYLVSRLSLCAISSPQNDLNLSSDVLKKYLSDDSPEILKECLEKLKTNKKGLRKKLRHSILCFFFHQDTIIQAIDIPVTNEYLAAEIVMYTDLKAYECYDYETLTEEAQEELSKKLKIAKGIVNFRNFCTSSVMNIFGIVFNGDIYQILPIFLRCKCINTAHRDFFSDILRKLLRTRKLRVTSEQEFICVILVYKLWRKLCAFGTDEYNAVLELGVANVQLSADFVRGGRKAIDAVLGPCPRPAADNMTSYYIPQVFDVDKACKDYFKCFGGNIVGSLSDFMCDSSPPPFYLADDEAIMMGCKSNWPEDEAARIELRRPTTPEAVTRTNQEPLRSILKTSGQRRRRRLRDQRTRSCHFDEYSSSDQDLDPDPVLPSAAKVKVKKASRAAAGGQPGNNRKHAGRDFGTICLSDEDDSSDIEFVNFTPEPPKAAAASRFNRLSRSTPVAVRINVRSDLLQQRGGVDNDSRLYHPTDDSMRFRNAGGLYESASAHAPCRLAGFYQQPFVGRRGSVDSGSVQDEESYGYPDESRYFTCDDGDSDQTMAENHFRSIRVDDRSRRVSETRDIYDRAIMKCSRRASTNDDDEVIMIDSPESSLVLDDHTDNCQAADFDQNSQTSIGSSQFLEPDICEVLTISTSVSAVEDVSTKSDGNNDVQNIVREQEGSIGLLIKEMADSSIVSCEVDSPNVDIEKTDADTNKVVADNAQESTNKETLSETSLTDCARTQEQVIHPDTANTEDAAISYNESTHAIQPKSVVEAPVSISEQALCDRPNSKDQNSDIQSLEKDIIEKSVIECGELTDSTTCVKNKEAVETCNKETAELVIDSFQNLHIEKTHHEVDNFIQTIKVNSDITDQTNDNSEPIRSVESIEQSSVLDENKIDKSCNITNSEKVDSLCSDVMNESASETPTIGLSENNEQVLDSEKLDAIDISDNNKICSENINEPRDNSDKISSENIEKPSETAANDTVEPEPTELLRSELESSPATPCLTEVAEKNEITLDKNKNEDKSSEELPCETIETTNLDGIPEAETIIEQSVSNSFPSPDTIPISPNLNTEREIVSKDDKQRAASLDENNIQSNVENLVAELEQKCEITETTTSRIEQDNQLKEDISECITEKVMSAENSPKDQRQDKSMSDHGEFSSGDKQCEEMAKSEQGKILDLPIAKTTENEVDIVEEYCKSSEEQSLNITGTLLHAPEVQKDVLTEINEEPTKSELLTQVCDSKELQKSTENLSLIENIETLENETLCKSKEHDFISETEIKTTGIEKNTETVKDTDNSISSKPIETISETAEITVVEQLPSVHKTQPDSEKRIARKKRSKSKKSIASLQKLESTIPKADNVADKEIPIVLCNGLSDLHDSTEIENLNRKCKNLSVNEKTTVEQAIDTELKSKSDSTQYNKTELQESLDPIVEKVALGDSDEVHVSNPRKLIEDAEQNKSSDENSKSRIKHNNTTKLENVDESCTSKDVITMSSLIEDKRNKTRRPYTRSESLLSNKEKLADPPRAAVRRRSSEKQITPLSTSKNSTKRNKRNNTDSSSASESTIEPSDKYHSPVQTLESDIQQKHVNTPNRKTKTLRNNSKQTTTVSTIEKTEIEVDNNSKVNTRKHYRKLRNSSDSSSSKPDSSKSNISWQLNTVDSQLNITKKVLTAEDEDRPLSDFINKKHNENIDLNKNADKTVEPEKLQVDGKLIVADCRGLDYDRPAPNCTDLLDLASVAIREDEYRRELAEQANADNIAASRKSQKDPETKSVAAKTKKKRAKEKKKAIRNIVSDEKKLLNDSFVQNISTAQSFVQTTKDNSPALNCSSKPRDLKVSFICEPKIIECIDTKTNTDSRVRVEGFAEIVKTIPSAPMEIKREVTISPNVYKSDTSPTSSTKCLSASKKTMILRRYSSDSAKEAITAASLPAASGHVASDNMCLTLTKVDIKTAMHQPQSLVRDVVELKSDNSQSMPSKSILKKQYDSNENKSCTTSKKKTLVTFSWDDVAKPEDLESAPQKVEEIEKQTVPVNKNTSNVEMAKSIKIKKPPIVDSNELIHIPKNDDIIDLRTFFAHPEDPSVDSRSTSPTKINKSASDDITENTFERRSRRKSNTIFHNKNMQEGTAHDAHTCESYQTIWEKESKLRVTMSKNLESANKDENQYPETGIVDLSLREVIKPIDYSAHSQKDDKKDNITTENKKKEKGFSDFSIEAITKKSPSPDGKVKQCVFPTNEATFEMISVTTPKFHENQHSKKHSQKLSDELPQIEGVEQPLQVLSSETSKSIAVDPSKIYDVQLNTSNESSKENEIDATILTVTSEICSRNKNTPKTPEQSLNVDQVVVSGEKLPESVGPKILNDQSFDIKSQKLEKYIASTRSTEESVLQSDMKIISKPVEAKLDSKNITSKSEKPRKRVKSFISDDVSPCGQKTKLSCAIGTPPFDQQCAKPAGNNSQSTEASSINVPISHSESDNKQKSVEPHKKEREENIISSVKEHPVKLIVPASKSFNKPIENTSKGDETLSTDLIISNTESKNIPMSDKLVSEQHKKNHETSKVENTHRSTGTDGQKPEIKGLNENVTVIEQKPMDPPVLNSLQNELKTHEHAVKTSIGIFKVISSDKKRRKEKDYEKLSNKEILDKKSKKPVENITKVKSSTNTTLHSMSKIDLNSTKLIEDNVTTKESINQKYKTPVETISTVVEFKPICPPTVHSEPKTDQIEDHVTKKDSIIRKHKLPIENISKVVDVMSNSSAFHSEPKTNPKSTTVSKECETKKESINRKYNKPVEILTKTVKVTLNSSPDLPSVPETDHKSTELIEEFESKKESISPKHKKLCEKFTEPVEVTLNCTPPTDLHSESKTDIKSTELIQEYETKKESINRKHKKPIENLTEVAEMTSKGSHDSYPSPEAVPKSTELIEECKTNKESHKKQKKPVENLASTNSPGLHSKSEADPRSTVLIEDHVTEKALINDKHPVENISKAAESTSPRSVLPSESKTDKKLTELTDDRLTKKESINRRSKRPVDNLPKVVDLTPASPPISCSEPNIDPKLIEPIQDHITKKVSSDKKCKKLVENISKVTGLAPMNSTYSVPKPDSKSNYEINTIAHENLQTCIKSIVLEEKLAKSVCSGKTVAANCLIKSGVPVKQLLQDDQLTSVNIELPEIKDDPKSIETSIRVCEKLNVTSTDEKCQKYTKSLPSEAKQTKIYSSDKSITKSSLVNTELTDNKSKGHIEKKSTLAEQTSNTGLKIISKHKSDVAKESEQKTVDLKDGKQKKLLKSDVSNEKLSKSAPNSLIGKHTLETDKKSDVSKIAEHSASVSIELNISESVDHHINTNIEKAVSQKDGSKSVIRQSCTQTNEKLQVEEQMSKISNAEENVETSSSGKTKVRDDNLSKSCEVLENNALDAKTSVTKNKKENKPKNLKDQIVAAFNKIQKNDKRTASTVSENTTISIVQKHHDKKIIVSSDCNHQKSSTFKICKSLPITVPKTDKLNSSEILTTEKKLTNIKEQPGKPNQVDQSKLKDLAQSKSQIYSTTKPDIRKTENDKSSKVNSEQTAEKEKSIEVRKNKSAVESQNNIIGEENVKENRSSSSKPKISSENSKQSLPKDDIATKLESSTTDDIRTVKPVIITNKTEKSQIICSKTGPSNNVKYEGVSEEQSGISKSKTKTKSDNNITSGQDIKIDTAECSKESEKKHKKEMDYKNKHDKLDNVEHINQSNSGSIGKIHNNLVSCNNKNVKNRISVDKDSKQSASQQKEILSCAISDVDKMKSSLSKKRKASTTLDESLKSSKVLLKEECIKTEAVSTEEDKLMCDAAKKQTSKSVVDLKSVSLDVTKSTDSKKHSKQHKLSTHPVVANEISSIKTDDTTSGTSGLVSLSSKDDSLKKHINVDANNQQSPIKDSQSKRISTDKTKHNKEDKDAFQKKDKSGKSKHLRSHNTEFKAKFDTPADHETKATYCKSINTDSHGALVCTSVPSTNEINQSDQVQKNEKQRCLEKSVCIENSKATEHRPSKDKFKNQSSSEPKKLTSGKKLESKPSLEEDRLKSTIDLKENLLNIKLNVESKTKHTESREHQFISSGTQNFEPNEQSLKSEKSIERHQKSTIDTTPISEKNLNINCLKPTKEITNKEFNSVQISSNKLVDNVNDALENISNTTKEGANSDNSEIVSAKVSPKKTHKRKSSRKEDAKIIDDHVQTKKVKLNVLQDDGGKTVTAKIGNSSSMLKLVPLQAAEDFSSGEHTNVVVTDETASLNNDACLKYDGKPSIETPDLEDSSVLSTKSEESYSVRKHKKKSKKSSREKKRKNKTNVEMDQIVALETSSCPVTSEDVSDKSPTSFKHFGFASRDKDDTTSTNLEEIEDSNRHSNILSILNNIADEASRQSANAGSENNESDELPPLQIEVTPSYEGDNSTNFEGENSTNFEGENSSNYFMCQGQYENVSPTQGTVDSDTSETKDFDSCNIYKVSESAEKLIGANLTPDLLNIPDDEILKTSNAVEIDQQFETSIPPLGDIFDQPDNSDLDSIPISNSVPSTSDVLNEIPEHTAAIQEKSTEIPSTNKNVLLSFVDTSPTSRQVDNVPKPHSSPQASPHSSSFFDSQCDFENMEIVDTNLLNVPMRNILDQNIRVKRNQGKGPEVISCMNTQHVLYYDPSTGASYYNSRTVMQSVVPPNSSFHFPAWWDPKFQNFGQMGGGMPNIYNTDAWSDFYPNITNNFISTDYNPGDFNDWNNHQAYQEDLNTMRPKYQNNTLSIQQNSATNQFVSNSANISECDDTLLNELCDIVLTNDTFGSSDNTEDKSANSNNNVKNSEKSQKSINTGGGNDSKSKLQNSSRTATSKVNTKNKPAFTPKKNLAEKNLKRGPENVLHVNAKKQNSGTRLVQGWDGSEMKTPDQIIQELRAGSLRRSRPKQVYAPTKFD